jgi:putative restriction endonuclease
VAKAVLTTKVDPTYDDIPEQRYHFPSTYLRQIEASKGDFVIYYEPRRASGDPSSRGGRQAYFATARVVDVRPDPLRVDHFYADIDSYLDFARSVPFREGEHYYESAIRRDDGATNKGAFGRAARSLPEREYDAIIMAGFSTLLRQERPELLDSRTIEGGFAEPPASFERPIVERIVARPFRDAAFSSSIKTVYNDTCALTGLKIINGGGRSEVQAAHIRPVEFSGPDSLRNGIALCGTAHWMFDRGLVSIADNHELLFAKGKVPEQVMTMINSDRRFMAPLRLEHTPHPIFLRWHRENVFKG